jgi:peptidoglycan/LPS O-acetylase OafA/YrhL
VKRSKLLFAIGLFYGAIALFSLAGLHAALSRDGLYIGQALLTVSVEIGLAVGLFMQKPWVIPLFLVSAAIMIVLNWFWLRANPPAHFYWGTMWLFASLLNVFPGALMFLRRNRLSAQRADDVARIF